MPEQMALALTAMGLVIGYIFMVYRLCWSAAHALGSRIGSRRGQTIVDEDTGIEYDADDELIGADKIETPTGYELRSYSRADQRIRMWYFGVFFPLALYVHYEFWEAIVAGFEWVFEFLGNLIAADFYDG